MDPSDKEMAKRAQEEFEKLFEELAKELQITVDNLEDSLDHVPEDLPLKIAEFERSVLILQSMVMQMPNELSPSESNLSAKERNSIERTKLLLKEAEEKIKGFLEQKPQALVEEIKDQKDRKKHIKRMKRKKI